jgi:hypothetical protein
MANPTFDIFEQICIELRGKQESVLIQDDFDPATVTELKRYFQEPSNATTAITKALAYLEKHFQDRGSMLPFNYDLKKGTLQALHNDYIEFVADAKDKRSIQNEAEDFELATSERLQTKLTGLLRRVGHPRKKYRKISEFRSYLKNFGFEDSAIAGHDKDGGLDILWYPPLGAFPFRGTVSIQCKNTPYDREDGLSSVGRASQTLQHQTYASAEGTHLHYVLFNDYIDEKLMWKNRKAMFVALGISDLAPSTAPIALEYL